MCYNDEWHAMQRKNEPYFMQIKIEDVYRATPGSLYVSVRSSILAWGHQARQEAVYDTQD